MSGRMFSFITQTWNPLEGECLHNCCYCWVKQLKQRFPNMAKKYSGEPRITNKELRKAEKFTAKDFVFTCDCNDLFGEWVPNKIIFSILAHAYSLSPKETQFLVLTKNPQRYLTFFRTPQTECLLNNLVLGTTIETDLNHPVFRLDALSKLRDYYPKQKLMLSIEPIIYFSEIFARKIIKIKPDFVAIGYNNNPQVKLVEPSLKDTLKLISQLETAGIRVYRKTLREAV